MRAAITCLCFLMLAGCAAQRQYQWGQYETQLYGSYKDPGKTEALMRGLEDHIGQLEKNSQKVPPGLYAELGTLYLQAGSQNKAIMMYERERDAWPESKGLMSALIQNLQRMKNKADERPGEAITK